MVEQDFQFVPVSDASLSDMPTVEQHKNLINAGRYTDATNLLESENYQKGFRASLFNTLKNRLQIIATYLLNLTAESDEYYSLTEPDTEWMIENEKKYWIQPFTEE